MFLRSSSLWPALSSPSFSVELCFSHLQIWPAGGRTPEGPELPLTFFREGMDSEFGGNRRD